MQPFTAPSSPASSQPAPTAHWEDCIVEELTDEAQAAVSGGKRYRPKPLYYITDPAEAARLVDKPVYGI